MQSHIYYWKWLYPLKNVSPASDSPSHPVQTRLWLHHFSGVKSAVCSFMPLPIFSPIIFDMCWSGWRGIGKIGLTLGIHFNSCFLIKTNILCLCRRWLSHLLVILVDLAHFQKVCCALVEVLTGLAYIGQNLSDLSWMFVVPHFHLVPSRQQWTEVLQWDYSKPRAQVSSASVSVFHCLSFVSWKPVTLKIPCLLSSGLTTGNLSTVLFHTQAAYGHNGICWLHSRNPVAKQNSKTFPFRDLQIFRQFS